jgi:hypothetical protein
MSEQKNLALTGGQVVVARPSEMFSPRLWKLATDEADGEARRAKLAVIARDPALRAEAARLLPELVRMIDGRPSNAELEVALGPLLIVKRKPDFGPNVDTAKMTAAWQAIYYDHLRRFPIQAVRAGVKDLVATHIYPDMPQPAELVKACEPYAWKIRTAQARLKMALDLPEPPARVDRKANLEAMRAAGWLNQNGEVDAARILSTARRPNYPKPSESPQQMAARLRGEA